MKKRARYDFMIVLLLLSRPIAAQDRHQATESVVVAETFYYGLEKANPVAAQRVLDDHMQWRAADDLPDVHKNSGGLKPVPNESAFDDYAKWDSFRFSQLDFQPASHNMVLVTDFYQARHKKTGETISAKFSHLCWLRDDKFFRFQQIGHEYQVAQTIEKSRPWIK